MTPQPVVRPHQRGCAHHRTDGWRPAELVSRRPLGLFFLHSRAFPPNLENARRRRPSHSSYKERRVRSIPVKRWAPRFVNNLPPRPPPHASTPHIQPTPPP